MWRTEVNLVCLPLSLFYLTFPYRACQPGAHWLASQSRESSCIYLYDTGPTGTHCHGHPLFVYVGVDIWTWVLMLVQQVLYAPISQTSTERFFSLFVSYLPDSRSWKPLKLVALWGSLALSCHLPFCPLSLSWPIIQSSSRSLMHNFLSEILHSDPSARGRVSEACRQHHEGLLRPHTCTPWAPAL